ncbi:hypothetical protein AB1K18_12980 [Peribacillus simplex]|uniref:hypothetical protein n=1 Tax=Peribacillus simplex TaxID=1478 RepID=UPI003B8AAD68
MNIFIPLPKEKRAIKEECRKQIFLAETQMENILKNQIVICAICDKTISGRFRSASRFKKGRSEVNLHPVHIDCVKENAKLTEVFGGDKVYYDLSSIDLLIMSGIVNHLTDLEKEGKLPDIPKETSSFDMPSPDTIGDPFYTMVEVIDGKMTGGVINQIHDDEQLIYLYVSENIALRSRKEGNRRGQLENYVVAGVSNNTMEQVLKSNKKIMVVMGIEGSKAIATAMTGAEIKDAIQPGEWLDNIIKLQNNRKN